MMQSQQRQLLRLSSAKFLSSSLPPPPFPHHLYFSGRPTFTITITNSYSLCSAQLLAVSPLIQLPPSVSSFISASDDSSFQAAASFLITGVFTLYLFRTLRRGAKRAKQKRLESLREVPLTVKGKRKPPSVDETLLGALIAAAFGVLLYKFTTSVEHTLNTQPLSPNYSVRQMTITIRTIINGMCYLATFVFAFNSVGLFLYSGQLCVRVNQNKPPSNSNTEDQRSDNTAHK